MKQKGSIWVVLLVIIALIVVGGLTGVVGTKKNEVATPKVPKTKTTTISPRKNNNQTETKTDSGVEIVAPKGTLEFSKGRASDDKTSSEYITIKAPKNNTEKVLITGLRLKSAITGREVTIPKGSYLPSPTNSAPEIPVFLAPGDVAYIITGLSPIGMSFRENICTGFMAASDKFTPRLSRSCPNPEDELLPQSVHVINEACQLYIERISPCEVPKAPYPKNIDYACQNFLTTEINYNKCVERNKNKPDFFTGQWHIYLGRSDELWKSKREQLQLIDLQGNILQTISY